MNLLEVLFSGVEDNLIPNHERLDFQDVVKMTDELERKCREEKRVIPSEFTVINKENNTTLYVGVFNFGSYDYPNIYHQIKDRTVKIRVDKKNQADKEFLLEKIEELTSDEFKREEVIDKTLVNLDKSKISKLKKWQRVTIYSITGVIASLLLIVSTVFILEKAQYEDALADGREELESNSELIKNYEQALLGEEEELIEFLTDKKLSENQEIFIANYYLNESDYKNAVKTLGDDPVRAETMILANENYDNEKKVEKIKDFNETYPTNEARYDLAYYGKDYELMMNLPDVNMTIQRSTMKTYAFMKLGKVDEAKAELKNNNDKDMKSKIDEYEVLKAEIKTLEEKLKNEKGKKGKDKNDKTIKKVDGELKEKKEKFNAL